MQHQVITRFLEECGKEFHKEIEPLENTLGRIRQEYQSIKREVDRIDQDYPGKEFARLTDRAQERYQENRDVLNKKLISEKDTVSKIQIRKKAYADISYFFEKHECASCNNAVWQTLCSPPHELNYVDENMWEQSYTPLSGKPLRGYCKGLAALIVACVPSCSSFVPYPGPAKAKAAG